MEIKTMDRFVFIAFFCILNFDRLTYNKKHRNTILIIQI